MCGVLETGMLYHARILYEDAGLYFGLSQACHCIFQITPIQLYVTEEHFDNYQVAVFIDNRVFYWYPT